MELGHARIPEKVNFHACLGGDWTPWISEKCNFQNCWGRDGTCPDFKKKNWQICLGAHGALPIPANSGFHNQLWKTLGMSAWKKW